jgi:hypothetical protein
MDEERGSCTTCTLEQPSASTDRHSTVRPAARSIVAPLRLSRVPNVHFHVARVRNSFRSTDLETVFPALQSQAWTKGVPLFAIPTFQPAPKGVDMSQYSDEAQQFKDLCLQRFYDLVGLFKLELFYCMYAAAHFAEKKDTGEVEEEEVVSLSSCDIDHTRAAAAVPADFEKLEQISDSSGRRAWVNAGDPPTGLPYLTQFGERGSTGYDEVGGLEHFGCAGKMLVNTPYGACYLACHPEFGSNMYPATLFIGAEEEIMLCAAGRIADEGKRKDSGEH